MIFLDILRFIKEKLEVSEKFYQFKNMIKNIFRLKIGCLRTDSNGECISKKYSKYLTSHGALELNGVAEKNSRYLCKTNSNMLYIKNVKHKFWTKCR